MKTAWLILAMALAAPLGAVEGAEMLKVPAAARSAALAGAFSMVAGSAESMWYNPAGIAGMGGGELGFSHAAWIGNSASDFIFGALGGPQWGLGAYGQYSAIQDVARDSFGRPGDSFTDSGQVGGLALAARAGFLRLGLGGKAIGQSVAGRSDLGYAGDAGVIASILDGHLALAASVLNMGGAPSLGTGNSAVQAPLNFRAGVGLMRISGFKLLGEYRRWNESEQNSLAGAAEFMMAFRGAELDWRAGYESGLADGGAAGLSAGIGAGLGGLRIDYAYQTLGELGGAHRVSLDWRYKADLAAGKEFNVVSAPLDTSGERLRKAKLEYEAGHYQLAAELYSRLAEERPNSFGMQAAAAMSYMMLGEKVLAMKYFGRARQLQPERKDLQERMDQLSPQ